MLMKGVLSEYVGPFFYSATSGRAAVVMEGGGEYC